MSVSIRFRGPMLFVVHESYVEVLIPRGEPAGLHPDGSTAKPHFAWLAAWRSSTRGKKTFEAREALTGVRVNLTHGEENTKWSVPAEKMFDFTSIAHTLGLPDSRTDLSEQGIAARMKIQGGEFTVSKQSALKWKWYDVVNRASTDPPSVVTFENPAVELTWTAASEVTAMLGLKSDHTKAVSMPSDADILIGNMDQRDPESWPDDFNEIDDGKDPKIDDDFKWVYSMLQNAPWATKLLDRETGGHFGLPAPTVLRDYRAGVASSCNFAVVHGDGS